MTLHKPQSTPISLSFIFYGAVGSKETIIFLKKKKEKGKPKEKVGSFKKKINMEKLGSVTP